MKMKLSRNFIMLGAIILFVVSLSISCSAEETESPSIFGIELAVFPVLGFLMLVIGGVLVWLIPELSIVGAFMVLFGIIMLIVSLGYISFAT